MTRVVRFLHATDTHLAAKGTAFKRDDTKVDLGLEPQTRERALDETLGQVAENLRIAGQPLDGIVFCGDAQIRYEPGGHELLFEMFMKHFADLGISPQKILAVPGNHDVPRGAPPSSPERYESFVNVWRKHGCITPWLDGLDQPTGLAWQKHVLMDETHEWAVIAINSCNWSHVEVIPKRLRGFWTQIASQFGADEREQQDITDALRGLVTYDAARISEQQLDVLRHILEALPGAPSSQLRMGAFHHHLRSPSLREEIKPFADITNVELFRTFLRQQRFHAVLHGHKHECQVQVEDLRPDADSPAQPLLVVSGATFDAGCDENAMRIIELTGLPHVPHMSITSYPIVRKGAMLENLKETTHRLWTPVDSEKNAPVVIQGSNYDAVYARVREAAANEAAGKMLVVHLDLDTPASVQSPPAGYPLEAAAGDGRKWLDDLVNWWQAKRSDLDGRVTYIHGNRLRAFAQDMNQMERVGHLLKTRNTTRAIAVLVDPNRDFRNDYDGKKKRESYDFASFCLVQFVRREEGAKVFIDCVAYYRAQEMVQWWPINLAELYLLQSDVCRYVKKGSLPGRITTITASARMSARSPTHVAMPVIDRWIDQSPEKLFMVASTLATGSLTTEGERSVAREWLSALDSLEAAASSSAAVDGGPIVAIEGLQRVARYLANVSGQNQTRCKRLSQQLDAMAYHSKSIPQPSEDGFSRWVEGATSRLREIRNECEGLWSLPSSS